MPISADEIVNLYQQLRRNRGEHISKMLEVCRFYNSEVMVPLPELDEAEKPAVANLITQGIDALAMRISGRLPDLDFPSISPGTPAEDERADTARKAVLGWWDMNHLDKRFARRARFHVGYGCSPVMVKPVGPGLHQKRKIPYWHVLNPLYVFPVPTGDPDEIEPSAVIVLRSQSLAWLKERYPAQAGVLYKGRDARPDKMFDLLEYNDDRETVLIVLGANRDPREYADFEYGSSACEELERDENRAGICLAVTPGRITMDKLTGHFDNLLGLFMGQAKMTAYEQIAVFRSIFPELWVTSHPNAPSEARIIQIADGKQGVIGEIANGAIQAITLQPNPMVTTSIDRAERAQRVQAGMPADIGGESGSNIRTATRGAQVSSSAMDPAIQEAQTVFAESWEKEDERAIAISKAYWGNRSFSFYIPNSGKSVADDYRPNDTFKTDYHVVKFSMPGVDAQGIPIEIGQRTGTGEMSMWTARKVDPMIEDAQFETDQVELEGLRTALLKGLEQQAIGGQLDPQEIALIAQIRRGRKEFMPLEDAVAEAHKRLQAQQAELQAATPGSPETQPGLGQAAPPGAPAPAGQPPQLAQVLASLRQPTQESPAEQQLAGAPGA